jgi:hypothetical protein
MKIFNDAGETKILVHGGAAMHASPAGERFFKALLTALNQTV